MRRQLFIAGFVIHLFAWSQSTDFPLNHSVYQMMELEEIRSERSFGTTIKPYSRAEVYDYLDSSAGTYLQMELREFTLDTTLSKRQLFDNLYRHPADFYSFNDETLDLHFNPMVQFSFGNANDNIGTNYIFSRGIELRGTIDKKVSFYTSLTENQARYPEYINAIRDSTLAVPYQGFWKQYNDTGVDYLWAQGYVDFGLSKSISAQLGYGKHFIGNGYRSLILSDFSNNYPYLRINTTHKLFEYTNIYAQLIGDIQGNAGGTFGIDPFSQKYLAFHHLNVKLKPNLHMGLFESVMYGDSTRGLKVEYLNPLIFYRSVEQQNGSDDNVFVGVDFKWNIKNRYSLYGQLLIDELIASEVFAGNGWWGNKQGIQLGLKYADAFGIDQLLIQTEVNKVRPYTYAHENGFTSYSHYNQALAHPLGANFTEVMARALYLLNERWSIEMSALSAKYGNDLGGENYGRDILKNYTQRRMNSTGGSLDYGNEHLQGNETSLFMFFSRVSYMIRHNVFVDLDLTLRNESPTHGNGTSLSVFGGSIRWNVPSRQYLF